MTGPHQWNAADIAYLNDKRRPIFTFNYILRTVLGILGLEIGNRQQPNIQARIPTNPGQNELAELATEIVKFIWDQLRGRRAVHSGLFRQPPPRHGLGRNVHELRH